MVGHLTEEGESSSIFPVPKELRFALFSEGEKKSSSIFFVEGDRGSTRGWGCPGDGSTLGMVELESSSISATLSSTHGPA